MKKLFLFCFFSFIYSFIYGNDILIQNDFSAISTKGNISIELIKSDINKMEVNMIRGKISDLISDVTSGELNIQLKNAWGKKGAKAEIKLYFKNINEVTVSQGASVRCKDELTSNNFDLSASNGSSIDLLIKGNNLNAKAISGSIINLSGYIEKGLFNASSGSNIFASNLSVNDLNAKANSGSTLNVWAIENLSADASSGGNINFKGEPKNKNILSNKYGNLPILKN